MKRWAAFVIFCCGIGCTSSDAPNSSGTNSSNGEAKPSVDTPADGTEKTYNFAVIPKGTTHEFWKSVHAGAVQAAKELGNVEISWLGPQLENDRDGQITVAQNFITRKVDGICLAPLDSQALVETVADAAEQDIPVVIFDSGLNDETNIVSYVATDNYKGGAMAAQEMGKILEGQGNVIMLRYNPGSESTEQREAGFLETLERDFPQIKVISSNEYAGTTPEDSLAKAQQVLGKFKSEVNGIFAVCEPNATGVLGALEELELSGKVKFIAFDPNAPLIEGMSSGSVHGIVLQDPVKMGYLAVKTLMASINKEPVEKRIDTGEYLATPANMESAEMQKLLKPEQVD